MTEEGKIGSIAQKCGGEECEGGKVETEASALFRASQARSLYVSGCETTTLVATQVLCLLLRDLKRLYEFYFRCLVGSPAASGLKVMSVYALDVIAHFEF